MNVAIIGCGLIGEKRVKVLGEHQLIIAADTKIERARYIADISKNKADFTADWEKAARHPDVELVIISTTNNSLTPIALCALESGKHVLLEKPGARSASELEPLVKIAAKSAAKVKVGFNHRYHPALLKAKEIADTEPVGDMMFVRGRYGHGGRIGYNKEWRANPQISGGGELLDQGVHLIDLSRWFMGDFEEVEGFVNTFFWDMPVEDNGFMALRTERQQMAWLHVSCTEWKNLFSLELYFKNAKLHIEGLGGSYGVEKLSYYKMLPEMGPPETIIWEYPGADRSWQREFEAFVHSIETGAPLCGDLNDAFQALKITDRIYGGKYR